MTIERSCRTMVNAGSMDGAGDAFRLRKVIAPAAPTGYAYPMFFGFLDELRAAGIPASLKEHLMLLEALDREVIDRSPEQFYYLSARKSVVEGKSVSVRVDIGGRRIIQKKKRPQDGHH